ncbi:WPP domain-interacting tail-anchored protein 1-like isoform X2 [Nymphaea colorata]|nr:WPP domain-interacting tail-anchored protein 1-like isoform X2 [Nymphaea colorata]
MSSPNGFHGQIENWHTDLMASPRGMVEELGDGYGGENGQPNGTNRILTKIELDVAYSMEKVQNLEILLIHVASIAGDFEALAIENKDLVADSEEKVFEFDLLSCILDSETEEIEAFVNSIQGEILIVRQKTSEDVFSEYSFKLDESEEALRQSQDQLLEMRMLAAKFRRTLSFIGQETGNNGAIEHDKYRFADAVEKPQLHDQQRHILRMLENSLARDIDLERKLCAARHSEEELKFRLHYTEEELFLTERTIEKLLQKAFEAENLAEMLNGNLAEVVGKHQILQLQLHSALRREADLKSSLVEAPKKLSDKENTLKEKAVRHVELDELASKCTELEAKLNQAEDRCNLANTEIAVLKKKLNTTEQLLQDSDVRLEVAVTSSKKQLHDLEAMLSDQNAKVLAAEKKAKDAEAKYSSLSESKQELDKEFECLRSRTQLLESTEGKLCDLEALLNELHKKVLAAESRASDAEAKYALLSESKHKLDKEFECLKDKAGFLESSLQQFENDNSEAKLKQAEDRCSLAQSEVITLKVKLTSLEKKLMDVEVQSQDSMASAEASSKEKDMLKKRVSHMEGVIRDLKANALVAEGRAKEAETRCALLDKNNLELNQELEHLRDRIECLEASLNQSEGEKIAAAKEISARSHIINDMINQLAIERQHLELQISTLIKENAILAAKLWANDSIMSDSVCEKKLPKEGDVIDIDSTSATATVKTYLESEPRSSYEQVKEVDVSVADTSGPPFESVNTATGDEVDSSTTAAVRTIEVGQVSAKYIVAFVVVLVAILFMYLLQQEKCPF